MTVHDLHQSRTVAERHGIHHLRPRHLAAGAVAALAAAGIAYTAASASTPSRQPETPNQCIALNGGDYNACNVGNSGRGDLPYRSLVNTPNACIALNGGDYNACNVGNSGRGGLPYRHARLR